MIKYDRSQMMYILKSHKRTGLRACSCGWLSRYTTHDQHMLDRYELIMENIVKPENPPTSESGVSRSGDSTR